MGKVGIVRTDKGIAPALEQAVGLVGGLGKYVGRQDSIILKPNVNGTEGLTNIEVMEALIRLLLDFGARKIALAESTFGNDRMTDIFLKKAGYADMAGRYGIPLINLNRSEVVELKVKRPHILESVKIAKEVYEADKIINVPVMKVHYATGVTLALKNLKGFLVLDEKRRFHEAGLDKAIVDLNNTIKPDLNIIDCTRCMERMGPRGGDPVDLNLLIAGAESAETDYAGCLIMQHDPEEVTHLKLFVEDNGVDVSRIEIVGEKVENVRYPFRKAAMAEVVPEGFVIHSVDACSACMNALLLSFEIYGKKPDKDMHVYLGKKVDAGGPGNEFRIAFGSCCDKDMQSNIRIKGCPPYPFELKNRLESGRAD